MNNNLADKLEEFFKNPESLTMEQIEQFVHETLKIFDSLRTTLTNGTDKEKQEALKQAQEMQTKLQQVAEKAYKKLGMNEEQVKKVLSEGNFPKEHMKHLEKAQQEINDFQNSTPGKNHPKHP
jgi:dGTP triphosphohydrolase